MDFRQEADEALKRARIELSYNDDFRVKYAALELRIAIECLIYDKAETYDSEIPAGRSAWQPGKLLLYLLKLDPHAGSTITVSVEIEQGSGEFSPLGTHRVLSLVEVKKFYDRLGSYLHNPTIERKRSFCTVLPAGQTHS
jgi:hypothetical protein